LSQRRALLLLVAHRPPQEHVQKLQACLRALGPEIGYALIVNGHRPGEPVEALVPEADASLLQRANPGYGRACNQLVGLLQREGPLPPWLAVLNTDLSWRPGAYEQLLAWLEQHPDVAAATPWLCFPDGQQQFLCKRNPTLLALVSRRFVPRWLKPPWLRRYDQWFTCREQDYGQVFEAPYLSGCCLWVRTAAFLAVGGFDSRFFLYFEDADLTRRLGRHGRTVNLPVATVLHHWGRGSYTSLWLTWVNFWSACLYFHKWGWRLW
jgi:GT2 family glycosyltransferase